jgi:hypothetical protein
METPTKPNMNSIKQKTISSNQKSPETAYNNWLPRRESKKASGDRNRDDSLMTESSYNFSVKENNKLQYHRRLRKLQQENGDAE